MAYVIALLLIVAFGLEVVGLWTAWKDIAAARELALERVLNRPLPPPLRLAPRDVVRLNQQMDLLLEHYNELREVIRTAIGSGISVRKRGVVVFFLGAGLNVVANVLAL